MIKTILISLFLALVLGCDESIDSPVIDSQNEINGKFANWNPEKNDELFWIVSTDTGTYKLVTTRISEDGNFNIHLPTPPNENLQSYLKLEGGDSAYFEIKDNIQFSDFEAKYVSLSLSYRNRITGGTSCGNTDRFDTTSVIGDYIIYYYYFDSPTEVTGNWTIIFKNQFNPEYARTIITRYNDVEFSQGWNQIIVELISFENDEKVFEVSNENRVNTEWLFNIAPNEFVRLL